MTLLLFLACNDGSIDFDDKVLDGEGIDDTALADTAGGSLDDTVTADDTGAGDDTGRPPAIPATCRELLAATPGSPDGAYTLYLGGAATRPWTAWCHDMRGTPQEYLTLSGNNDSQYTVGGRAGTRTSYARVRIDPATLLVDISDQTFATSSGGFSFQGTWVGSMPYAVAMACEYEANGVGHVDLSGTPFRVRADAFLVDGYLPVGSATYGAGQKTVTLAGGGYCGWISPKPGVYNPINDAGGFLLPLEYVG